LFEITFPPETRTGILQKYDSADVILEFGSGGSTVYGVQAGKTVYAVESDPNWLKRLTSHIELNGSSSRFIPIYADIGPTTHWGHPEKYDRQEKFLNYTIRPWEIISKDNVNPDLILIDGRFRVACFMTCLAMIKIKTLLIFDDYLTRPEYSYVEKYIKPLDYYGRAAIFEIPPNNIQARDIVTSFRYYFNAL
jgi:hypothetical protein